MTAKLEYVASEFRQASHAQMSATTQRTVRENVNLSAQVNQLSEKNSSLDEENRKLDEGCRKIKKTMTAIEEEEKRLIHVNAHRYGFIKEKLKMEDIFFFQMLMPSDNREHFVRYFPSCLFAF